MPLKNSLYELIYDNAIENTEKLYQTLCKESNWEIKNKTSFVFVSLIYHLFYYRMVLLSKYPDDYVKDLLFQCIIEFISHTNISEKQEKNKLIDASNEIFEALDTFMTHTKEQDLSNIAKYFIGYVNCQNPIEVLDEISIMLILIHFGYILENSNFLLDYENNSTNRKTKNNESLNETFAVKIIIVIFIIGIIISLFLNL